MITYYCLNNVKPDVRYVRERCGAHQDGLHYFPVWFDTTEISGIMYQFLGQCDCGRLHDGVQGRRWLEIPPHERARVLQDTITHLNTRNAPPSSADGASADGGTV